VRGFAGIELGEEEIPDETTILNFRPLLEKHGLTEKLLAEVNEYLSEKRLLLREGTIVDATLMGAPSCTKNKDKRGDQEMSSTQKGNHYHFGMKVHTVQVTPASVHDKQEMEALLHGEEKAVFGDEDKWAARKKGLFWGVFWIRPRAKDA
jgi:IS5 family transposase